jgi:hypothetical protein
MIANTTGDAGFGEYRAKMKENGKMRLRTAGIVMLLSGLLFGHGAWAKEPPVAKLVQVEGAVEYSRNGTRWIEVRGTKYLFEGYKIRTGRDGSGKLINQTSGKSQELGSNTEIEVRPESIFLVSGNLSPPEEEETSLFQSLLNKFAKAQRYTTVRRKATTSEEPGCDNKVRTIREVTVSPGYPDLVWRNACPEYSYRLVIDGQVVDVPAQSTSEMIRYSANDLKPGDHSYRVEVLDKDGTVYIPRNDSEFVLLTDKEEKPILETAKMLQDDIFMLTNYLEEQGLHIAAMDAYREYFLQNPEDNDMRPLLIRSYNDLKLSNLQESEARLYNAALAEDY